MRKFLTFDELIAPTVISVVYWIVIVVIIIGAIGSLFTGFRGFIVGIIGAIVALILWRVYCEIILIVFRIHAQLAEIARNTAPTSTQRL